MQYLMVLFVGSVAYRSGASLEAALITGGIAALFSASGIGDLAGLELVKDGHICGLEMLWLLVVLI